MPLNISLGSIGEDFNIHNLFPSNDIDEFVVQDIPIVKTNITNIAIGIIFAISGYPNISTNVSLLTNKVAIDAATNKTIPTAVFIT